VGGASRTWHYARFPHGRAAIPLRGRGGQMCAGDKEIRGDVVERSGDFGSGDPVGERARAQSSLPDASTTPGAINPSVTQKTIGERRSAPRGWTRMMRPPVQYTEELKRQQICTFGYDDRRLSHYEEDSTDPVGAGRRSVRSAEPLARAEDHARRLGSGPEGRAGVCAQSARLLGASATARGPAGDCDRLDRRLSPLCWTTSLS